MNDATRDADVLDFEEQLIAVERGFGRARSPQHSSDVQLLKHVMTRLGWEADRFVGYRTAIDFSMHGGQTCFVYQGMQRPCSQSTPADVTPVTPSG